jgi:5,5'-dehydrodivanillate O-demethylase oxygenase subunit
VRITQYTDFAHAGPGTLAGRFLRAFWQPVYLGQDLPAGQTRLLRILGEDFTLYRGESGAPHVIAYRCAHRGTQLSTGWVEGDCIRCFYHGWKYDGSGQCVEQPAEDPRFASKVQLRSYPTQEYLGLIFAYLGEGEPPPFPRYGELEEPGVLEVYKNTWPCNYFQAIENSLDQAHIAFVHRDSSFDANNLGEIPTISVDESEYGITVRGGRPGGGVRLNHWHMPNMNQIKVPPFGAASGWADFIVFHVPVDDGHHARFLVYLTPVTGDEARRWTEERQAVLASLSPAAPLAEAVLAGELRIGDIGVPTHLIDVQDYVALVAQGTIVDREHERLGRSDVGVMLLRKLWERELRALAEGRPLKQWRRPERLVPTTTGVAPELQPVGRK